MPTLPLPRGDPLTDLLRRDPAARWEGLADLLRAESREYVAYPFPPEPTNALPGTPEKAEVMRLRIKCHFHPHHPKDATWEDASRQREALESERRTRNGGNRRSAVDSPRYRAASVEGRRVVLESVPEAPVKEAT